MNNTENSRKVLDERFPDFTWKRKRKKVIDDYILRDMEKNFQGEPSIQ